MISYTKKNINILAFIISLIIFIFINFLFQNINFANQKQEIPKETISKEEIVQNESAQQEETKEPEQKVEEQEKNIKEWFIEIPIISLKAEIAEGTDTETLNKFVGHFEETSKLDGNIGLAAHNRGYPVNYFAKIKDLKEGDEIYYKYNGVEKRYIVKIKEIIKDTDWRYLEQTKENRITLITCVEDAPLYRRCIQAVERMR